MKFTRTWLRNYIDLGDLTDSALADHLTMLGLEVDAVTPLFEELAALQTGTVVSCEQHPDADKLHVCTVKTGAHEQQIVCGAPNVRTGLKVVVALPGTVLPGNFKIKKSKIRGVSSAGMLCSERELGLSDAHEGIIELPAETADGQRFIDAMELADTCFEVDLTPNRPDCSSLIGIAREIGAVLGHRKTVPVADAAIRTTSTAFSVTINNPELCPRYAARRIDNVTVGTSPWWLRRRLLSVGLRPINAIVDVTNFVMLEYGQPLHAFDFDTLAGGSIVVRTPSEQERHFTTLDGVERPLNAETLMICDAEKPVAVAGVMGGQNSEISAQTTTVLVESACFDPISIRRTARRQKLPTESSWRFERGVDPEGVINALDRAVDLICQLTGGTAAAEGADHFPGRRDPLSITLRTAKANSLLGLSLTAEEISGLLGSIEIDCTVDNADQLTAVIPSFRVDLEREADLIEEIARLYGYDKIPVTLPFLPMNFPEKDSDRQKRLLLSRELTTIGWSEAINYSFIGADKIQKLGFDESDPRVQPVHLLSPLSEDMAVLRTTLLPGLLDNVRRNINFQRPAIKLFELGKVFFSKGEGERPEECHRLAGVLSGNRHGDTASPLHWKESPVDFYDARGTVEFILQTLQLPLTTTTDGLHFRPSPDEGEPYLCSGCSLALYRGDSCLGHFGKIDPSVLRNYSIKKEVYAFDLDCDGLCRVDSIDKQFVQLPVYPAVRRDISLVVRADLTAGELLEAIHNSGNKLIEDAEIFDVFTGQNIPDGCKSVSLGVVYRSATRTLTEKNVEKAHTNVVSMLTEKFGGSLRDG